MASKQVSGKWFILSVVLLAIFGGGFSWWHRWHATHRAAVWWGPDRVLVLRSPEQVIAREFPLAEVAARGDDPMESPKPDANSSPPLAAPGTSGQRDISDFGGVTHLSYALLQDASFDWETPPPEPPPLWQFALEFRAETLALQVRFSADFHWLACAGATPNDSDMVLATKPILQQGLRRYFADVFSSPAANTAAQ